MEIPINMEKNKQTTLDVKHVALLHAKVARLHQQLEAKRAHVELKHKLLSRKISMRNKSPKYQSSIESKLQTASSPSPPSSFSSFSAFTKPSASELSNNPIDLDHSTTIRKEIQQPLTTTTSSTSSTTSTGKPNPNPIPPLSPSTTSSTSKEKTSVTSETKRSLKDIFHKAIRTESSNGTKASSISSNVVSFNKWEKETATAATTSPPIVAPTALNTPVPIPSIVTTASTTTTAPAAPAAPTTTTAPALNSPSIIPSSSLSTVATDNPELYQQLERFITHLWPSIDTDKDGVLDSIELAIFIRLVTGDATVVAADCERFLQNIDQDGDGKIDQSELLTFMINGLLLNKATIKSYGERSSTHKLLAKVLIALKTRLHNWSVISPSASLLSSPISPAPRVTNRLKTFIDHLWPVIDQDRDGFLDANEFSTFIKQITNDETVIEHDVTDFLKFMDQSGDGKIDKQELLAFVLHAMTLDDEELNTYGERSVTHQLLAKVITALKLKLEGDDSWPLHQGSPTRKIKNSFEFEKENNSTKNIPSVKETKQKEMKEKETNEENQMQKKHKKSVFSQRNGFGSLVRIVQKTDELAASAELVVAIQHDKAEHHKADEIEERNQNCVYGDGKYHLCMPCYRIDEMEAELAKKCCKHDGCRENHMGGQCRRSMWSVLFLIVILIVFAVWIQAIEAPLEITSNVEYVNLMQNIRSSLSEQQFSLLSKHLKADPFVGNQYFSSAILNKLPVASDNITNVVVTSDSWTIPTNPFGEGLAQVIFFVFTLSTTIGYGNFAPASTEGKIVSIICMLLTIPLTVHVYLKITKLIFGFVIKIALAKSGQIKAAFDHYDVDHSDSINITELSAALEMLDIHLTHREVKHVMLNYDFNNDGTLSIDEFQSIASDFDVNIGGIAIEHFKIRVVSILLLFWFFVYVLYFCLVDSMSFIDAMWLCIATFTTTGLGDVVPSKQQSWPAMFVTFIGLGLTALGIDALVTIVTKKEERREKKLDEQEHETVEQKMRNNARSSPSGSPLLMHEHLDEANERKQSEERKKIKRTTDNLNAGKETGTSHLFV